MSMTLNKELSKLRQDFITEHNINCSTCENWGKNRKGKCASKAYCIVRDNSFNCAYKAKKTTFRKDWRVFFDTDKGETFTVSDVEYAVATEEYFEAVKRCHGMYGNTGIFLQPVFELKGHRAWMYRLDEDYTEEIRKYEHNNKNGERS